jgi:uncharacterized protein YecT (DUF1311 family)
MAIITVTPLGGDLNTELFNLVKIPHILKFIVSLGFILITSSVVNATSFNCAKASNAVEKLICDQPDINVKDNNMAFIYKYALLFSKNPNYLKSTQRAWLKRRNECTDGVCLKESYKSRIDALIAVIDNIREKSSTPEELKGLWYGRGKASYAIYGSILITEHFIIWGARDYKLKQDLAVKEEYCKATYSIEKEPMGTSFENVHGRTFVLDENSQFKTYKIKLPGTCSPNVKYLRFTMEFGFPNSAEVVEYNQDGSWAGFIAFSKF